MHVGSDATFQSLGTSLNKFNEQNKCLSLIGPN